MLWNIKYFNKFYSKITFNKYIVILNYFKFETDFEQNNFKMNVKLIYNHPNYFFKYKFEFKI